MFYLIIIILVIFFFVYFNRLNSLKIKGELIWQDSGRETKYFINNEFDVYGKPDLMYRKENGKILLVEFKSRKGGIYLSDIIQTKAAALAARGAGYDIDEILVKTRGKERYYKLSNCNSDLYREIERFVKIAQSSSYYNSDLVGTPENRKCYSCAYKHSCKYSFN